MVGVGSCLPLTCSYWELIGQALGAEVHLPTQIGIGPASSGRGGPRGVWISGSSLLSTVHSDGDHVCFLQVASGRQGHKCGSPQAKLKCWGTPHETVL